MFGNSAVGIGWFKFKLGSNSDSELHTPQRITARRSRALSCSLVVLIAAREGGESRLLGDALRLALRRYEPCQVQY